MVGKRLAALVTLGVVAVTALAACGSSPTLGGNLGTAPNTSFEIPFGTMTDWVSYSDQFSVFTVLSEQQIPPPPEVLERGEGYVGRSVTVRIEETKWKAQDAPTIDGDFDMVVKGWFVHDNQMRPAAIAGLEWLEVGRRYAAPLVLFDEQDGMEWGTSPAVLLLEGDSVINPDIDPKSTPPAVVQSMVGKSVDEVVDILNGTDPDPLARKYSHLRPEERWQAVLEERRATAGTP